MKIRGWLSFSRLITGYVDKGSCTKFGYVDSGRMAHKWE